MLKKFNNQVLMPGDDVHKKAKSKSISNGTKIISILAALLILSIAGYFGYNAYLDYADEKKFNIVKHDVETLKNSLQHIHSESWIYHEGCSEGSVKFQDPIVNCGISIDQKIDFKTTDQALEIIKKYNEAIYTSNIFKDTSEEVEIEDNYHSDNYTHKGTNMSCYTNYKINKQVLEVSFYCQERARKPHYPIVEFDAKEN